MIRALLETMVATMRPWTEGAQPCQSFVPLRSRAPAGLIGRLVSRPCPQCQRPLIACTTCGCDHHPGGKCREEAAP